MQISEYAPLNSEKHAEISGYFGLYANFHKRFQYTSLIGFQYTRTIANLDRACSALKKWISYKLGP